MEFSNSKLLEANIEKDEILGKALTRKNAKNAEQLKRAEVMQTRLDSHQDKLDVLKKCLKKNLLGQSNKDLKKLISLFEESPNMMEYENKSKYPKK